VVGRVKKSPNKFATQSNGKPLFIFTNEVTEGLRSACNLCHGCTKFKPDSANNCEIAERLYCLSREETVATIVTRCGAFEPKNPADLLDGKPRNAA
jgi:hypothetical protein